MSFDDLGFATAYQCRATVRKSRHPVLADSLAVDVAPHQGRPWAHDFHGLFRDYPLTGAFGCPSPDQLCVIVQGQG